MKKKLLFEQEYRYSKAERKAVIESIKSFNKFRTEIFRDSNNLNEDGAAHAQPFSKRLNSMRTEIGNIVESAAAMTLQETDGWFDKITVNRDLKELNNDYKLFDKTCKEMINYQQRLESLYENMAGRLSKYYDL